MWMMSVANIPFQDIDGNNVTIKNMRDLPSYDVFTEKKTDENLMLDTIANDVYGPDSEDYSYAIFEANAAIFWERKYNSEKIKKLLIPAIQT